MNAAVPPALPGGEHFSPAEFRREALTFIETWAFNVRRSASGMVFDTS